MGQIDLFSLFTGPLDTIGVPYMVGGSVASMAYGEPRLTNDIDIVLHLDRNSTGRLVAAFPPSEFYCPPEEVLILESKRPCRGHANIIHHGSGHKADLYMRGTDPLQIWGLERRRWLELPGKRGLWLAPPEYVILRKLEYYREGGSAKHVEDIRGMVALSMGSLDEDALFEWLARLDLRKVWDEVRAIE